MPSVAKMVEYATWYCADANLGYDQYNRWDFPAIGDTTTPGECDCSSLVYQCAVLAGFDLPTSGTRYTGTMHRDFTRAGFEWHQTSSTDWEPGDILYKDGHTAIWTGKYIAEAYGDENGSWRGGKAGDQANETRLSPKRGGWLGYFRFPQPTPAPVWPQEVEPMGEAKDYIIEEGGRMAAHETDQKAYTVIWQKWASGRLTAEGSDYFNGGTGKRYEGQYYLDKILDTPHADDPSAPAFVEPPKAIIQARATSGWVDAQPYTLSAEKIGFWVYGTRRTIPRFSVDFIMDGFWK